MTTDETDKKNSNSIRHKLMKGLIHPAFLGTALMWFAEGVTRFILATSDSPPFFSLAFALLIVLYFPAAFLSLEEEESDNYHLGKLCFDIVEIVAIFAIFFSLKLIVKEVGLNLWLAFLGLGWLGGWGAGYHLAYTIDNKYDKGATSAFFFLFGLLGFGINFLTTSASNVPGWLDYALLFFSYCMLSIYYFQRAGIDLLSLLPKVLSGFIKDPLSLLHK